MINRYFGIDTHKKYVVVASVNEHQEVLSLPQRVEMTDLAKWAAKTLTQQDRAVIEATTNAWHIYDILAVHTGQVLVANPYKTKLIAEARIKSDKIDALVLARLLAARFICEVWVPATNVRQCRALAAHHTSLSRQLNRVKNRIYSLLARHDLKCPERSPFTEAGRAWLQTLALAATEMLELRQLLAHLDLLRAQQAEAEGFIAHLAAQDQRVPRIMQVTGIGCFTAFAILAIIGDIHRFSSAQQLTGYAGLVPSLKQTGDHTYSGHITKAGSPELRWLMVEAARSAVRFDPHWQGVYERLKSRRGSNIAAVAVARKLLVAIWHLLHDRARYYFLRPSPSYANCKTGPGVSAETIFQLKRQLISCASV